MVMAGVVVAMAMVVIVMVVGVRLDMVMGSVVAMIVIMRAVGMFVSRFVRV
jgi:hypothetical protein